MTLHRARDVADDHERPWPLDGPPPDPVEDLAAGRQVAPEHRSWGKPATVRVQLGSAGPALLELRLEEVDEPLGLAELRRRHPIEVTRTERLEMAIRVGRDQCRVGVAVLRLRFATGRDRQAAAILSRHPPLVTLERHGIGLSAGLTVERVVGEGEIAGGLGERAPVAIEDLVVDLEVVLPANEARRAGGSDLVALGEIDDRQRPCEVDRRADVDREAGTAKGPSEAHASAEQSVARARDGHRAGFVAVSDPRGSPRRGAPPREARGRAGCPLRT